MRVRRGEGRREQLRWLLRGRSTGVRRLLLPFQLAPDVRRAGPVRRERDYIQAIAWLDLAGAQGSAPASALLEKETPHLTAAQKADLVEFLKSL